MDLRWTETAAAAGPALQHSPIYARAARALGTTVLCAELQGGAQMGFAHVLCRRIGPIGRIALLPRGPVWAGTPPAPAERRSALALIRRRLPWRVPCLLATPEEPTPGILPLLTPTHLAEWPLVSDPAKLRAGLHGKWRNRLARAERTGLVPRLGAPTARDLARLAARDETQGRDRGYRALPLAFLEAWRRAGGALLLARLEDRGTLLAEMLFLDHAPGASYQIGWTGDAGRAVSAHHLLLWTAALHFARAGRQRLDLGGLDTVKAPGLARFKLGTGARHRTLGPSGLVWARR